MVTEVPEVATVPVMVGLLVAVAEPVGEEELSSVQVSSSDEVALPVEVPVGAALPEVVPVLVGLLVVVVAEPVGAEELSSVQVSSSDEVAPICPVGYVTTETVFVPRLERATMAVAPTAKASTAEYFILASVPTSEYE